MNPQDPRGSTLSPLHAAILWPLWFPPSQAATIQKIGPNRGQGGPPLGIGCHSHAQRTHQILPPVHLTRSTKKLQSFNCQHSGSQRHSRSRGHSRSRTQHRNNRRWVTLLEGKDWGWAASPSPLWPKQQVTFKDASMDPTLETTPKSMDRMYPTEEDRLPPPSDD